MTNNKKKELLTYVKGLEYVELDALYNLVAQVEFELPNQLKKCLTSCWNDEEVLQDLGASNRTHEGMQRVRIFAYLMANRGSLE